MDRNEIRRWVREDAGRWVREDAGRWVREDAGRRFREDARRWTRWFFKKFGVVTPLFALSAWVLIAVGLALPGLLLGIGAAAYWVVIYDSLDA